MGFGGRIREARDLDEALEQLRTATAFYEEAYRARRQQAWKRGDHIS